MVYIKIVYLVTITLYCFHLVRLSNNDINLTAAIIQKEEQRFACSLLQINKRKNLSHLVNTANTKEEELFFANTANIQKEELRFACSLSVNEREGYCISRAKAAPP